MVEQQQNALKLLAKRVAANAYGRATVEGIHPQTWGALFRKGYITEPKGGQVTLTAAGENKLRELLRTLYDREANHEHIKPDV